MEIPQLKELTGSSLQHSNHRTHAEMEEASTPLSLCSEGRGHNAVL